MTVINNATLILKDKQGNEGVVKSFTDNDINKISNAITDVGQVVDPATHMPIEATTASVGVVQLATAQDIKDGTANKVVDAKELADAISDIKLADSSKFSVVAGANIDTTGIPTVAYNNGTFTFNYLKGLKGDTGATGPQGPKGDTGPQGPQGPKGDAANFAGATFYSGNSDNAEHDANNAVKNGNYYYYSNGPATSLGASTNDGALYVQSYSDSWVGQIAQDYRNGRLFVRGKKDNTWQAWNAVIDSSTIGSQSVNYANSAGNADTVDGVHEYSFLRNRGGTSANGEGTLWSQIGIKEYYNALPDGLSGLYNWGEVVSFAGNSARFDIYCSHTSSDGNGLYYRSGWDNDKKAWRRLIDSSQIWIG